MRAGRVMRPPTWPATGRLGAGTRIENLAPPFGTVFRPDTSVLRGEQSLRDRQPHAGARRVPPALLAAKERLEQARPVGLGNAAALVVNGDEQSVGGHVVRHRDGRARRRILRGVFKQVRERGRRQSRIEMHHAIRRHRPSTWML